MNLPFTVEQFLGVFAEYNGTFWFVAAALWVVSAALLAATWRRPARWSRALSMLLAAHWLWSGVAYHALLFSRINPAAWVFAALFVTQSGLLVWKRGAVSYFATPGVRNAIGLSLAVYALAYPVLSVLIHGYPAAPTFGVPCPTTILTIGLLLTTTGVPALAVVPVLWGFIGGSAALLLKVPLDYVLLIAGGMLMITLVARRRTSVLVLCVLAGAAVAAQQPQSLPPNPRQQPGAMVHIFAPEQHDLYDGHFVISANRIYMVGGLNDPEGWDHLDNEARNVRPVSGTAEIDVNEIRNTGTFVVRLKIPEGDLVLTMDKWNEFSPCQNGGIVAYIHEHGTDSGCGDNNWPKTVGFLAGWGFGSATLNGKPLYQNYEMHFMVTQGLRDRATLRVNYPMANKKLPGGETNPATQQIDFYIRSPQMNPKNRPTRQVFMHFFGMEITWK